MSSSATYRVSRQDIENDALINVNDLSSEVETPEKYPVAHGGFSDIHRGIWRHPMNGILINTKVAVKFIRAFTRYMADSERAKKRLNREVYVWTRLEHPNIAQFYGVTFHIAERPAVVMQWYDNGTAPDYLNANPSANKILLIRDIANGLRYLHMLEPPVVHGDLKGSNTLVTDEGRAVVADFGLSRVIEELTGPSGNTTTSIGGSSRWQAPELLYDEHADEDNLTPSQGPSKASDVWAFGCVVYELLTGKVPYKDRSQEWSVILDVVQRKARPIREDDIIIHANPATKKLMEDCWEFQAGNRPEIGELVERLNNITLEYIV